MPDLKTKLQIKEGMSGRIVAKPKGVDLGLRSSRSGRDFAIVFVRNVADIERSAREAVNGLGEDGILWFCYPKRSSGVKTDLSRDQGWEVVSSLGFRGVRQIAIDDTWSALRFREDRFIKT